MDCIFCEIAAGRIQAKRVHEDDQVVAFHDVSPQAPTHVLVIPREHIRDLDAATPEHIALLGHLIWVARDVAGTLGLAQGYRLVVNRGRDGGQSVDHLHVHILGGRSLQWPPG
jgi:histidine triad (HIT) family protein